MGKHLPDASPGAGTGYRHTLAPFELVLVGMSAFRFHQYEVGTPTTATVVRCGAGPKSSGCYGTWSVGGQSQTGLIHGPSGPVGSSVDVHVRDGTAYAGSPVLAFTLSLAAMDHTCNPFHPILFCSHKALGAHRPLVGVRPALVWSRSVPA